MSILPGFSSRYEGDNLGLYPVPGHTQETLEHYLLRGWEPGGFVTAMLALDMERALCNCDIVNKQAFVHIGRWIIEHAPPGSWGSYEAVENWCKDVNSCRTRYKEYIEKEQVARILKGEDVGR